MIIERRIILTIHRRTGELLQVCKCLLPNEVSLANLNLSGSACETTCIHFLFSFYFLSFSPSIYDSLSVENGDERVCPN